MARILLSYGNHTAPENGGAVHGNQLVEQLRRLGHELHTAEKNRDERTVGRRRTVAAIPGILQDVDAIYMRCRPRAWDMSLLELNHRGPRRPVVVELNAPPDETPPVGSWWSRPPLSDLRATSRQTVYGRILGHAAAVVCVSEELARDARRRFGLAAERLHVVPNGGLLADESAEAVSARPEGPLRVVWLGTWLWPMQAFDDVVEGLRRFAAQRPEAEVHLYTEASAAEVVGSEGRLELHPPIKHAEVPDMLRTMDVGLCLRSPDGWYTSPLKLFDYMAAGVVVVGSDVGQIARVVEDGVSGRLVPIGDPERIAAALVELADMAASERQGMGAAAVRRIANGYTWDHCGDRIAEVLAGVGVR